MEHCWTKGKYPSLPILPKAPFGSRGGTVVDDGSHNTTPFGSMHCCGWGWKERERWVNCASPERWRESCTVECECQVIHTNLQCCPCFCAGIKKNSGPACMPHESMRFLTWLRNRLTMWKFERSSMKWVRGRCGTWFLYKTMKLLPPFTDKRSIECVVGEIRKS